VALKKYVQKCIHINADISSAKQPNILIRVYIKNNNNKGNIQQMRKNEKRKWGKGGDKGGGSNKY